MARRPRESRRGRTSARTGAPTCSAHDEVVALPAAARAPRSRRPARPGARPCSASSSRRPSSSSGGWAAHVARRRPVGRRRGGRCRVGQRHHHERSAGARRRASRARHGIADRLRGISRRTRCPPARRRAGLRSPRARARYRQAEHRGEDVRALVAVGGDVPAVVLHLGGAADHRCAADRADEVGLRDAARGLQLEAAAEHPVDRRHDEHAKRGQRRGRVAGQGEGDLAGRRDVEADLAAGLEAHAAEDLLSAELLERRRRGRAGLPTRRRPYDDVRALQRAAERLDRRRAVVADAHARGDLRAGRAGGGGQRGRVAVADLAGLESGPGETSSSPVQTRAIRGRRTTTGRAMFTAASAPISAAPISVPACRIVSPAGCPRRRSARRCRRRPPR